MNFDISNSMLSIILKSKDAITSALYSGTSTKRIKLTQAAHEDLEKAFTWFLDMRAKKMPISGTEVLQQKALNYACMLGADFEASTGWLTHLKAQHNIVAKVLCGESAASYANGAATWTSSALLDIDTGQCGCIEKKTTRSRLI